MNYYVMITALGTLIGWIILLALGMLTHATMVGSFIGSASYATYLWWYRER